MILFEVSLHFRFRSSLSPLLCFITMFVIVKNSYAEWTPVFKLLVHYNWIRFRASKTDSASPSVLFTDRSKAVPLLYITKTCPYNFHPLKPHCYIVKLGFTGVYIIFLISAQKHRLWYSLEPPRNQNVYTKTFSFWWWKFQYIWIGLFS